MARSPREEFLSAAGAGCFACRADHPSGLRLSFELDEASRTAWAETTVDACFEGADGMVHGGIVATLLDEAMVYASRTVVPLAATASLRVRYRRPTPTGRLLRVEGRVVWVRHGVLGCSGSLRLAGEILAKAEAKLMVVTATASDAP